MRTVTLIGGASDGAEAEAAPVIRTLRPSRLSFTEPSADEPSAVDLRLDEELYRRERLAVPFDLRRDDAERHEPRDEDRERTPTMWTLDVWVCDERRDAISRQMELVNAKAERCGGYLLLQRCPEQARRGSARVEYVSERSRLLAMLRPGFEAEVRSR